MNSATTTGEGWESLFQKEIAIATQRITPEVAIDLLEDPAKPVQNRTTDSVILYTSSPENTEQGKSVWTAGLVRPTEQELEVLDDIGIAHAGEHIAMPFRIDISVPSLASKALRKPAGKIPKATYRLIWFQPVTDDLLLA